MIMIQMHTKKISDLFLSRLLSIPKSSLYCRCNAMICKNLRIRLSDYCCRSAELTVRLLLLKEPLITVTEVYRSHNVNFYTHKCGFEIVVFWYKIQLSIIFILFRKSSRSFPTYVLAVMCAGTNIRCTHCVIMASKSCIQHRGTRHIFDNLF